MEKHNLCTNCKYPLNPAASTEMKITDYCQNCGIYYNAGDPVAIQRGDTVVYIDTNGTAGTSN